MSDKYNKRCNIEETDDGVLICIGHHERSLGCEWEYFIRAPAAAPVDGEALRDALERLVGEVAGLKAFEFHVREAICNTNWEVLQHWKEHAERVLATTRRLSQNNPVQDAESITAKSQWACNCDRTDGANPSTGANLSQGTEKESILRSQLAEKDAIINRLEALILFKEKRHTRDNDVYNAYEKGHDDLLDELIQAVNKILRS